MDNHNTEYLTTIRVLEESKQTVGNFLYIQQFVAALSLSISLFFLLSPFFREAD
jgi:hypothetical protein